MLRPAVRLKVSARARFSREPVIDSPVPVGGHGADCRRRVRVPFTRSGMPVGIEGACVQEPHAGT